MGLCIVCGMCACNCVLYMYMYVYIVYVIYLCAMLHVYMCVLYSVECVGYISILCECVWYKGMV